LKYLCKVQNTAVQTVLLTVGATQEAYLKEGISNYAKRLGRYTDFDLVSVDRAEKLLSVLKPGDFLVLLDEHGTLLPSTGFAQQMQKWMNTGPKRLVFAVGDAYGFPADFAHRASFKLALGPMTLTHDMVRLVFVEQLYRAHTILRNEPYHHA
jgi:23S rRNA (pseudouridine1915-N3)-methyltransferase